MRKRDLGVIVISLAAIFVSLQHGGDVTFRKGFFFPLDPALYRNHDFPEEDERLPLPIVTDLDGDGRNEVVLVTREPRVRVLQFPSNAVDVLEDEGRWVNMIVKAESTLLPPVRVSKGRHAVALTTGYLKKRSTHQVVAVLTQEWNVLLFDHNLKLIWESTVQRDHPNPPGFVHKEAAILISPIGVHEGDHGVVIVGGSMDKLAGEHVHGDDLILKSKAPPHRHNEPDGSEATIQDADDDEFPNLQEGNSGEVEFKQHFAYYAFDGSRGRLRWSHEGEAFTEEVDAEENLQPQHHYKMTHAALAKHEGELEWSHFRSSFLRTLPHHWHGIIDTEFRLSHFAKENRRGSVKHSTKPKGGHPHRGDAEGDPRMTDDAHVHGEEEQDPNVLVAHLRHGIEVMHLFTGRTLTTLTLRDGLHADINGDGIIDHVHTYGGAKSFSSDPRFRHHGNTALPSCAVLVTSGVPPSEMLFNGSLCHRGTLDRITLSVAGDPDALFEGSEPFAEDTVEVAPPAVIHRLESGGRASSHHVHHTNSHKKQHHASTHRRAAVGPITQAARMSNRPVMRVVFDACFLVSNGKVSSYSPHGFLNWMAQTSATWRTGETATSPAMASLTALLLRPDTHDTHLLAVGDSSYALLSSDGTVMDDSKLPAEPLTVPAVGDVDGDGYHDFVILTAKGYYGYLQERRVGSKFFAILVGVLLVVVLAVVAFLQFSDVESDKVAAGRLTRQFKRSTD